MGNISLSKVNLVRLHIDRFIGGSPFALENPGVDE
jgi:hypothetical protein